MGRDTEGEGRRFGKGELKEEQIIEYSRYYLRVVEK